MQQWWLYYKDRLPIFEDDEERARVEYLTGCNPLLLSPLLRLKDTLEDKAEIKFADVQDSFLNDPDIVDVGAHIFDFARSMHP
jgi:hypothetical protein